MPTRYTIDGISYTTTELIGYCEKRLVFDEDEWKKKVFRFVLEWLNNNDTITISTSGTTGKRKSLSVPKSNIIKSAEITANQFGILPGMKSLLCLSVDYIAGKMMIVRSLVNHWDLMLQAPQGNPVKNLDSRVDFAAMVPLQVNRALDESRDKLEMVRTLLIGGAPVSPVLEEKLQESSCKSYETFGMTETLTHFAVRPLFSDFRSEWFQTIPGVSIGTDRRNCLKVVADWFPENLIATNDVIEFKPPDRFKWKGRLDNVINSGGLKLFPEQIEKKLTPYMEVSFFIAGIPDNELGQKVGLFIEGKVKSEERLKVGIDKLGKYEKPKSIFICEAFYRTSSGKVNRKRTIDDSLP